MASYFQQFIYTLDSLGNPTELINGARTAANLRAANDTRYQEIDINSGCQSLQLEPCRASFSPPLGVSVTTWGPANFAISQAPWFDSGVGVSAEAYGFTITDWTGLDGAHHARNVVQSAQGRGGAYYGAQTSTGRTMKFNVLLHGATERGLMWLFRWLESELLGCCSGGEGSLWIREWCPNNSAVDPEEGMARLDRVALLEGPTWEAPPVEGLTCICRMVSFTIGVGDPCMYRPLGSTTTTVTAATSIGTALFGSLGAQNDGDNQGYVNHYAPCNRFTGTGLDACLVLPRATFGKMSGIVTITSPAESVGGQQLKQMPTMRIVGHVNRAGVGSCNVCNNTTMSLMVLQNIYAGDYVEVDLGRRTVRRKGTIDGDVWDDASYMIQNLAPLRLWAAFAACDAGAITVEPAFVDQFQFAVVSSYTVTIQSQEHGGCRC